MKDRLKQLRKALDLTQTEFAERLGVVQASVSAWEKGIRPTPESKVILIGRIFNVRREWLVSGKGEMFEPPEKKPFEFARAQGASENVARLFEAYCRLDDKTRAGFNAAFDQLCGALCGGRAGDSAPQSVTNINANNVGHIHSGTTINNGKD